MARVLRRTIRLWQTELFVVVILVAILILSVPLSRGLRQSLTKLGEDRQRQNVSALAAELSRECTAGVVGCEDLPEHVRGFRRIYGGDVWVFGPDGAVVYSSAPSGAPDDLREAVQSAAAQGPATASSELKRGGYVVAGADVPGGPGVVQGRVVTAGKVSDLLAVLDTISARMWIAFWVALLVAGLLGFAFSEFIGRRVRQMTSAAASIADGDFSQRLPTGLVPDEIKELAQSYNRMAMRLGETFSRLREREQEIAAVVESMGQGVVALDPEGAVRVINPEALRLLLLDGRPEERVGGRLSDLVGEATLLRVAREGLAGADASDTVSLGERSVLLHATPIAPVDGVPQGAVLLMSDITERERLQEAQRRFVSDASHELRTPISALKGLLELLNDGAKDEPEVRDDFLRTMALEVDRLGRLVTDLLTLAQLETGGPALHRRAVPVATLLGDVTTMMRPLAEGAGVTLEVDMTEALMVDGDRDGIVQVLVGFVDNALRYSGGGKRVTLQAHAHDDLVTLGVRNEGPGMDPGLVPHLFDRFFRAGEHRSTPGGTGLGLSIAKEIIEAHGSTIEVDSEPGVGVTFRFDLPRAN